MRIGLLSSAVPNINSGARFIVDWLAPVLRDAGHRVETINIPFVDDPADILDQTLAFRLLDVEADFDRIITFRPPAHVIPHSNKVAWFIHHIRAFYDGWDTEYCPVPHTAHWQGFRARLMQSDTTALRECRHVFTNSRTVQDRLLLYNGIGSEVLYPPVRKPERFRNTGYGDEIVVICRLEHHKRQHLLVEAMRHVRTPVRLRLCGASTRYATQIEIAAGALDPGRVTLEVRWISEAEKVERLAGALAIAYFPLDEDSYGYPILEAAHARKAAVVGADGGGVREFVRDGEEGFVVPPEPERIAAAFDELWSNRSLAARMGAAAEARVDALGINWSRVVQRLLG